MFGRSAIGAITLVAVWMCMPDAVKAQTLWRYTHPESSLMLGFEWRRVAVSRLGRELRATMSEAATPGIPGLEQLNLFDSMDRIILSAPMPAQGQKQPPTKGLLAVEGRFDWAGLRQALVRQGAQVRTLAGKEILVPKKSNGMDGVLALAEPGVLLLGDMKSVGAALAGEAMPETSSLYRRATSLAARNDFWLTGIVGPGAIPTEAGPSAKMFADVTGFDFGMNARRGVGVELNVATKTEQSASALAATMRLLIGMAAAQQSNNPGMNALVEKVQIATAQTDVRMSLHLNDADLDKSFRSLRAALPGGMKPVQVRPVYRGDSANAWPTVEAGGPKAAPAVAETQKPPERQVIRIHGAEGGTREIPMGNP
jgi:hypothetical protein